MLKKLLKYLLIFLPYNFISNKSFSIQKYIYIKIQINLKR